MASMARNRLARFTAGRLRGRRFGPLVVFSCAGDREGEAAKQRFFDGEAPST